MKFVIFEGIEKMMRKNFNLIAILLVSLTFFAGCKNPSGNNSSENNSKAVNVANAANVAVNASNVAVVTNRADNAPPIGPKADSNVNAANFAKLQQGMLYKDVVKLLGAEGKSIGETEFSGVKTVMYQWNDTSGGFLKAVFQNDKLVDKVQTGLK